MEPLEKDDNSLSPFVENYAAFEKRSRVLFRQGIGEPAKDGDLPAYSLLDLVVVLQSFLGELSARAMHDEDSAAALWNFAKVATDDLWELCSRKPEMVAKFAPTRLGFPCWWPAFKKLQAQVVEMAEKLQVGKSAGYNTGGRKQIDPTGLANQTAIAWICYIRKVRAGFKARRENFHATLRLRGVNRPKVLRPQKGHEALCVALPEDLSGKNTDDWAALVWKFILGQTNNAPEKSFLSPLGDHWRSKSFNSGKYADRRAIPRGTADGDAKRAIKKRIYQQVRLLLQAKSPDPQGPRLAGVIRSG